MWQPLTGFMGPGILPGCCIRCMGPMPGGPGIGEGTANKKKTASEIKLWQGRIHQNMADPGAGLHQKGHNPKHNSN